MKFFFFGSTAVGIESSIAVFIVSDITFSVITYEHDLWCGGKDERLESRKILESNGYTRVVSDLMDGPLPFEDWYVNEKYMKSDTWKQFVGENVSAERIRNDLMDHLRKQYDYEMAWWYTE